MIESDDKKSEFQGYLLEKATPDNNPTGEFVLAYRGSHSIKDW